MLGSIPADNGSSAPVLLGLDSLKTAEIAALSRLQYLDLVIVCRPKAGRKKMLWNIKLLLYVRLKNPFETETKISDNVAIGRNPV
ncbi:hypothetical protein BpHYR1_029563 [Brachionus plicatilis]|uniref:Uncharacterized protein n=1 Tax=Brachionus plicatilis TaxID=10195 RepID=A0A3M7RBE0_BRAPC|nr:hypothetical protein BpHYR1_029563 [Brachionus plicatilis]